MSALYVHYGSDKYNPTLFKPIKNQDYDWTKPKSGGLWASRIDAKYGWKDWCEDNEFRINSLDKSFTFELDSSARICSLRSVDDLEKLPRLNPIVVSMYHLIDFEGASHIYDVIELDLSNEIGDQWEKGLYFKLYGWDCDCILILNKDVIIPK